MASVDANAGEIWAADFSTAAKQRPVLVLAFPQPADTRALVVLGKLNAPRPTGVGEGCGEGFIGVCSLAAKAATASYFAGGSGISAGLWSLPTKYFSTR